VAPARRPGSGPLLVVPFALVAPGPDLDLIRRHLEDDLLSKGECSLATDRTIRQLFGVDPVALSYATFNDLAAMLRIQYDYVGLGDLWQLIEASLYRADEPATLTTDAGNRFIAAGGEVWTPFEGFDTWLERNPDSSPQVYSDWQRIYRQYTSALQAHGISVTTVAANAGGLAADAGTALGQARNASPLGGSWWRHIVAGDPDAPGPARIHATEHHDANLGTLAVTIEMQDVSGAQLYLGHDYPLSANAPNEIEADWQARSEAAGVAVERVAVTGLHTGGNPPRLLPARNTTLH